jgi:glycine dehydrogenase subunit 1
MAMRITKRKTIALANDIHPDYVAVLESYMKNFDDIIVKDARGDDDPGDDATACVIVQSPDFFGKPQKYEALRKQCDESGALLIVVINEIVSLGLLPAPECADIVCGEAQSVGIALSYGGPHLGFFACRQKYLRQIPGRLCGVTKDADGKRGFVLTLNTREQHIRRDKATSNICTNQGLCALAFTVHMSLLGEDGFKRLAVLNHEAACKTADAVAAIDGVSLKNEAFFNEFAVSLPKPAAEVVEALAAKGIIAGYAPRDAGEENTLLITATEVTTDSDIDALVDSLKEVLA